MAAKTGAAPLRSGSASLAERPAGKSRPKKPAPKALASKKPASRKLVPKKPAPARPDPMCVAIERLAQNQSFLEIGYNRDKTLKRLAAAAAGGATQVRCIMSWRPPDIDQKMYLAAMREAGVQRPAASLLRGAPEGTPGAPWFSLGDIFQRDAANRLGEHDVVLLADQLFQVIEPERLLERAARIARRRLVVSTMIVKPFETQLKKTTLKLVEGDMLFAGSLTPDESHIMDQYWRERTVTLEQYRRWPDGFTLRERPDFGVWWWFFTPKAVERLMAEAGFPVVERIPIWRGCATAFVGERPSAPSRPARPSR
jgi:hypothetical protein